MKTTAFNVTAALTALLLTAGSSVWAQADYPNKPIMVVVGYPPGGSTDLTGRVVADILAKQLKVTTLVDNVGGAGGTVGCAKGGQCKRRRLHLAVGGE